MIDDKTLDKIKEGLNQSAKDSIKDTMKDIKRVDNDEILKKKMEKQMKVLGIHDKDGNETDYGRGYREGSVSMIKFAILSPENFRKLCTAMSLAMVMDIEDAQRFSELIKEDE
jgi:hypothetical protein